MVMGSTAVAAACADETPIRAQTLAWEKTYNGGDAKGVAAQYADDALLLRPGALGVSGKASILDFFTKDIAGSKAAGVVFSINSKTDVGVSGKMGWESSVRMAGLHQAGEEDFTRALTVARKQASTSFEARAAAYFAAPLLRQRTDLPVTEARPIRASPGELRHLH